MATGFYHHARAIGRNEYTTSRILQRPQQYLSYELSLVVLDLAKQKLLSCSTTWVVQERTALTRPTNHRILARNFGMHVNGCTPAGAYTIARKDIFFPTMPRQMARTANGRCIVGGTR